MLTVGYRGIRSSFSWRFLEQFRLCILGKVYILHVFKKRDQEASACCSRGFGTTHPEDYLPAARESRRKSLRKLLHGDAEQLTLKNNHFVSLLTNHTECTHLRPGKCRLYNIAQFKAMNNIKKVSVAKTTGLFMLKFHVGNGAGGVLRGK